MWPRLREGVYVVSIGLFFTGASLIVSENSTAAWIVGGLTSGLGACYLLWGIEIRGRPWWQRNSSLQSPQKTEQVLPEQSGRGPYLASAQRAHIGTPGAAIFGTNGTFTQAVIDIKNFGSVSAMNVRAQATAGWFKEPPDHSEIPKSFWFDVNLGITEPGHGQHIALILTRPIDFVDISKIIRGSRGFYALAEIEYTDVNGLWWTRQIAYYLDPLGQRLADRCMLNMCKSGNTERTGRMAERSITTRFEALEP